MLVSEIFGERSDFASREEILESIKRSKHFDSSKETPANAHALLFFKTSKQQTWLVSTSERLYCTLDDLRKSDPHINWSIPKSEVMPAREVTLPIAIRDKSRNTGLIDFGTRHKNWLFTKSLFSSDPIQARVEDFLAQSMSG